MSKGKYIYMEVETATPGITSSVLGWVCYEVSFECEISDVFDHSRPGTVIEALEAGWELIAGPIKDSFSWGWILRTDNEQRQ